MNSRSGRVLVVAATLATCCAMAACADEPTSPAPTSPDGSADGSFGDGDAAVPDDAAYVDAAVVEDTPCEDIQTGHTLPTPPVAAVACDPLPKLVLPDGLLPDASGGVQLRASGNLQPVGQLERVAIKILNPQGALDVSAAGPLVLTGTQNVEVVSHTAVEAGFASAVVRLSSEGLGQLSATFGDRSGKAGLFGYKSAVPVWLLDVADADLKELFTTPAQRLWMDGKLTAEGKTHPVRVRLHGGSSKEYPKKSLRMNLQSSQLSNGDDAIILRAEWRDKTMARLLLGAAVMRDLAGLPFPDLQFVHLRRTNGAYLGLMVRTERIDSRYLQRRDRNPYGALFDADPPFELAVPGGNLTPLATLKEYTQVYAFHGGANGYGPLLQLIEGTLQLPAAEIVAALQTSLKVESFLTYVAAMALIQNHDHIKKNYYLYADDSGPDCRWEILPWDLDLSFGHLWTEKDGILSEELQTSGDPTVGVNVGHLFYNQLIDRVLAHPPWLVQYKSRLAALLKVFDSAFVQNRIAALRCHVTLDLLADRNTRGNIGELESRYAELLQYVVARREFLTKWLAK